MGGSDHRLQLSLHLTPDSLGNVQVGLCKRIVKVSQVVDHEVDVTLVVEVEVRGNLLEIIVVPGVTKCCISPVTKVSLVQFGTQKTRLPPLPL